MRDERVSPAQAVTRLSREPLAPAVASWEMIEPGRYMPRRTRGSFPGRELG